MNINWRMLWVFNPENQVHRILRRGIAVAIFTCIATILRDIRLMDLIPYIWQSLAVAIITGLLAMIDKTLGEITGGSNK